MVQVACMDIDSVFNVLRVLARSLSEYVRSGDAGTVRRVGAWIWALLGRCRDVGQLDTERVGEIRDLGKRAIKILSKMNEDEPRKMTAATAAWEGEEQEEEEEEEKMDSAEDHSEQDDIEPEAAPSAELEAAKARLGVKLQAMDGLEQQAPVETVGNGDSSNEAGNVAEGARAMLDMIITIVGEYYGQGDLLAAREEVWNDHVQQLQSG